MVEAFPMLGFNSTLCTEMHQSAFQIPVQSLQIRPLKWSQGMFNVHSYFLLSSYSLEVKATNKLAKMINDETTFS